MTSEYDVKSFLTLIIALGVCLLAGYIGGYPVLSRTPLGLPIDLPIGDYLGGYPGLLAGGEPAVQVWYASLIHPVFSLPLWVFSLAWIFSFLLMGLTLFFILQSDIKQREVTFGLILFCFQLFFMFFWAYTFFGIHAVFPAVLCIIALWATLLCAVIQVSGFSVHGGMLLVPYFLWVCYLAYLSCGVMVLNHAVFVI
jgi:benzodiazapine receptor